MNKRHIFALTLFLLALPSLASAMTDHVIGSGWFSPDSSTYKARFMVDVARDGANPPTGIVKYKSRAMKGQVVKVRGGGYILPEASAHKAAFSIEVTKKGDNAPNGEVEYNYARTRLHIKSTGITELAVSGATAVVKGPCKVNKADGFLFAATVVDGVPDTFHIAVYKPDGTIYYSAGPKDIGGGNLKVEDSYRDGDDLPAETLDLDNDEETDAAAEPGEHDSNRYALTRVRMVSTAITGLTVSGTGNIAAISGNCTVNRLDGHTFIATVIDKQPDTFKIVIYKPDGSPYYSAGPMDISGGSITVTDTIPPAVAITAPVNGLITNQQIISVTGTIDDPTATVTVNGVTAAVIGGNFSVSNLLLAEGMNIITIWASDPVGNASTASVSVMLDSTPPAAPLITYPGSGTVQNSTTVSLSGTAEALSAIKVYDGAVSLGGATADSSGLWSYTATSLTEGIHGFTATATDAVGNASAASAAVAIAIDTTPPAITIVSPTAGYMTSQAAISVAGTVDDVTSTVTVNGANATISGGTFTASNIALVEGTNDIVVQAADPGGNVSSVNVNVTRDSTPPVIAILSPANGGTVTTGSMTVSGSVDDPSAQVSVNGVSAAVNGTNFSLPGVTLAEGANAITIVARDQAGNSSEVALSIVYVKPDVTAPIIILLSPATGSVINAGSVTVSGTVDDPTATVWVNGTVAALTGNAFLVSVALTEGPNTIAVTASDAAGNTATAGTTVTCVLNHYPPDPVTVAPPLDTTTVPTLADATAFLYSGTNPIQTGVAPGTIEAVRAAVVRGSVVTPQGAPIPGVAITIMGHPEYGSTQSRADGAFDMAVNGGTTLTVNYAKDGYLPVHRQVDVPWQDYVMASEVVMLSYDSNVTAIDFSAPMQPARGSVITDSDGTRQATLLFPQNTWVTMVMPDGTTTTLSNISVRATEYTVGPSGQSAMPAPLPPTSGYTYAVEFSVDEAVAAGAKMVRFSKPVISYNENFIGLPVGWIVPSGYYDREKGAWIPADNGKVIRILSITNGLADIDIDGSGIAADSTALTAMGITSDEQARLAKLYQPGQGLWRVPINHFSTWDLNLTIMAEPGSQRPSQPPAQEDGPLPCESKQGGSIISCQSQMLGEVLPVSGTTYSLNYKSNRASGRIAGSSLRIYLSGAEVPTVLRRIELEIVVAGRKFAYTYKPEPNLVHTFTWDGKDAYGRPLLGRQTATIYIGYVYRGIYMPMAGGVPAFSRASGITIGGVFGRPEAILWQTQKKNVTAWGAERPVQGLGGWTFDVHHVYDPVGRVLYMGDGTERGAQNFNRVITTVAGNGTCCFGGDGGLATLAKLYGPMGVAVDADGSYYIADTSAARIRKVGPNGIITTVAGTGQMGYTGDGGPATSARIAGARDVAVGTDGSIYLADTNYDCIRRVTTRGIIDTVAGGTGRVGFDGDEGPATQATLYNPEGVAVAADGTFYIADTMNNRIRKVGPDGIITTVAGTGTAGYSGDNGPATAAMLKRPKGVALGPDGSLYIADTENYRIRKVGPDGIITTVAGSGLGGYIGDGGQAVQARIGYTYKVTVGVDGTFYIAESYRLRSVSSDGIITTVAGTGLPTFSGDNGPAVGASLSALDVAIGNDGSLYVADGSFKRVRKIGLSSLPGIGSNDIAIASEDGSEAYIFNPSGRHLRTVDTATGANIYQFGYDGTGRLVSVMDRAGNVTAIERDGSGNPVGIVAPGGQRTALAVDGNGWLASVANSAGETTHLSYENGGLLSTLTDPKGNVHRFSYDSMGRLTRDEDPAGGYKTLARSYTTTGFDVALTTAMSRATNYHVESVSTGGERRVNTYPDGTHSTEQWNSDGSHSITSPDGTVYSAVEGPDPRFGMQSPVIVSDKITTPGGKVLTIARQRTTVLSDPNNPLSLADLTETVTVNGRVYTVFYDANQKSYTSTSPVGRQRYTMLDALGRVAQGQVQGLNPVSYAYDAKGRLTGVTQGSRVSTLGYDSANQLTSITDPLGRTTGFSYDLAGRVTQQSLSDGRVIAYSYDANGNVTSITPPGRPAHSFTYDPRDLETYYNPPDIGIGTVTTQYAYNLDRQITTITRPDGQTIGFDYDTGGRLSTITVPAGQINYSYNATTGNLSSIATSSETLTFSHDGSLLTGQSWSGTISGSVGFVYNNDFRVTSETVNGANSVSYAYDNDGLLTGAGGLTISRDAQNGLITGTTIGSVTTSKGYNTYGEPNHYAANVSGAPVFDVQYTRDNAGRITSKIETTNGVTSTYDYGYDATGRLTEVRKNGALTVSYGYDDNGNRVTVNGATVGVYDNQDRLVQYGATAYSHTAKGELKGKTSNGQTTSYNYDVLGNLVSATLPDGTQIQYVVDGQNRRIGKKVNGALTQGFLYEDQLRPVAELDGSGNVVSRFVYGTKVNVPEYMIKNGVAYRIITDHLGSPRIVIDTATGAIAQQVDYDEFGNVLADTNPGFQPFGFAGGLYDRDTKLVRFGARDYDAETGKWTAKDPIRFNGGDANLYSYTFSDPVNWVDPFGLNGVVITPAGPLPMPFPMPNNKPSCHQLNQMQDFIDLFNPVPLLDYIGDTVGDLYNYFAKDKGDKNKKYEKPPNPNQRKGADERQRSGERERNVGHTNGEEHSRVPKGPVRR